MLFCSYSIFFSNDFIFCSPDSVCWALFTDTPSLSYLLNHNQSRGVKTELLLFCSIAVQRQLLQSSNSKPEVNLFAVALFAVLGLLRSQWRKQPGGTFRPGLDASGSPDCSSLQRTDRRGRHEHESPWWRVGLENVDSGSVGFVA